MYISSERKNFIVVFITVFLYVNNYPYIVSNNYVPNCLSVDEIGLISIVIISLFALIANKLGLFKYLTNNINEITFTFIKYVFMFELLVTTHIYSLLLISKYYC